MLRLYRRHVKACSLTSQRDRNCPAKLKCPIWLEGIDGTGRKLKPQPVKDPISGSGVRDWNRAAEIVREMELPTPPEQKPAVTLHSAAEDFLKLKSKKSPDTQRKVRLLLNRLVLFAERKKKSTVKEITLPDLVEFRNEWTDADTTQRRNQELLKSFFKFAGKAEFITKNPAIDLDPITVGRPKTDPFTHEELRRIFQAIPQLTDEYGRQGQPIADQTRAFVYVMRYTGMSIGDTAKLEKDAVDGCLIRTNRKKTGEDVFASVPPLVIKVLNTCPHDSERYFFWTGNGKIHTRTSKWGDRLQRLFVLADVRVVEVEKKRRSGGKLKGEVEKVRVSLATPHMFRHTFVRDHLENGTPMEAVAELLGNSMKTIEKYYSKWDSRRQAQLVKYNDAVWKNDPVAETLVS